MLGRVPLQAGSRWAGPSVVVGELGQERQRFSLDGSTLLDAFLDAVEKGTIKNLSVRSDGLLSLGPHSRELMDTSSAYLWALAQDSKGNLYTADATGARSTFR